jgi:Mg-chelatase subunit ChlD
MKGAVLGEVRRVIREVTRELRRELEPEVRRALTGRANRQRRSPVRIARNLDWRSTIDRNLRNFSPERGKLIVQDVRFFSNVERRLRWDVILCVDQSGSMLDSVIHSAVMASILVGLPMLSVRLVIFDTAVVELTEHIDDPVEVLMNVQLGGGTDIGTALTYCEQRIRNPRRTILILLSDFEEGASPQRLVATARRIREAGVTLLGLASLDQEACPFYDRRMAERLAAAGMDIAALTPRRLAEWLSEKIS